MNSFSISDLQQFSGIKAHTIRIWEQRYQALRPERSEGNTRYYNNTQLRRLLNIVSLMGDGYKISELSKMSDPEIFQLLDKQLKEAVNTNDPFETYISQLLSAGISYDEPYFEKIFSNCVLRFGLKESYKKVIYPLLVRLGLMWASSSLAAAQEHFITNLIRQKLYTAIDALPPVSSKEDTWVLFLPENEFHEIGLLLACYILRANGKKVIYLGASVPLESIKNVVKETGTAHLLFFLVQYILPDESQRYIESIKNNFRNTKIHIAGSSRLLSQLKIGKNIEWIQSVEQMEQFLRV